MARLAEVAESLRAETAPWFVAPAYDYAWFGVDSEQDGVGFHYAVIVYLAYPDGSPASGATKDEVISKSSA